MTDASRFDEIAARADAAIPGPWRWQGNSAVDQCRLSTTNRGQLTVLDVIPRTREHVFHHDSLESYTLEEGRKWVKSFCGTHAEEPGDAFVTGDHYGDDRYPCCCEEIERFLSGTLDRAEGNRDMERPGTPFAFLSRSVETYVDMAFPVGGLMRSYREFARYEVLGRRLGAGWGDYRTRGEWEAEEGAVELVDGRTGDRPARSVEAALYREDFCGLAHPEAAFIEHSREDVDWLLARVRELAAEVMELRQGRVTPESVEP